MKRTVISFISILFCGICLNAQVSKAPEGFTSLFNGKDLTNWKVPDGDNGHWKVLNGVIDYDALSQATKG